MVFAFLSASLSAQSEKNVPAKVKTAFSQKFSKATNVKWGKENKTEWEAEFKMDGKEYSANYDSQGNWIETEYEINFSEIPSNINAQIKKEFPGYKLKESAISETSKRKVYEFDLVKGSDKKEISFNLAGERIIQ